MSSLPARTSTSWYSIPRFTPTPAVSLPNPLRPVRLRSLQLLVKRVKKKDLAAIAMSYGYVYVAQVAMGADYEPVHQSHSPRRRATMVRPSIIAYAPCINHGIKGRHEPGSDRDQERGCGWLLEQYVPVRPATGCRGQESLPAGFQSSYRRLQTVHHAARFVTAA